MTIMIKPDTKLSEIKNTFKHAYPFLKMEFFSRSHAWQESSSFADILSDNLSAEEASRNKIISGFIEINFWQKTGVVESIFKNKFDLFVQVYRKHNDHWIQTSGTDELSLEQQNEAGRNATEDSLHGHLKSIESEKDI